MRKPRGAEVAEVDPVWKRHSLCCGRVGCRRRALPPSLRFLGRRVYVEAVVVLASVFVQALASVAKAAATTRIPERTLRRWRTWWQEEFPRLRTWLQVRAGFVPPPPEEEDLPRSLLVRLGFAPGDGSAALDKGLGLLARLLAPMTTASVEDGSRFVRAACPAEAIR
jgi:hypothetical protein